MITYAKGIIHCTRFHTIELLVVPVFSRHHSPSSHPPSFTMLIPMLQLTTALLFISRGRLAASMPTMSTSDRERRIDPDNIFMYSVDVSYCLMLLVRSCLARKLTTCPQHFIEIAVNKPETGTCLFYTQRLTQKAQEFALEQNLFTIWVSYCPSRLCTGSNQLPSRTSGSLLPTTVRRLSRILCETFSNSAPQAAIPLMLKSISRICPKPMPCFAICTPW